MGGTPEGGKKLRATMIAKYGSEAAWKARMHELAVKGGQNGNTGGFYANRELARQVGRLGGRPKRKSREA